MKSMKSMKSILILLRWLALSMYSAHWWLSNPEQLPHLPSSIWKRIDSLYQSVNAEQVADLEFLVCFGISVMLVGLGFFACWYLLSCVGRKAQ